MGYKIGSRQGRWEGGKEWFNYVANVSSSNVTTTKNVHELLA
jgi:hypothetical protein